MAEIPVKGREFRTWAIMAVRPYGRVTTFGLDEVNDAVKHAAANAGPFKMTVLRPA
jgi:hypothetical protein